MCRTVRITCFVLVLSGLATSARAQSLLSKALDRFDVNKDGKISRAETPEAYRGVFDRMVEQYKLDPEKTYTRQELDKILNGSSPSSSTSSPSSSSRTIARDGRPYRSLVELPSEYRAYDKDGDGQIGLYEWPKNRIAEFLALDKNGDGFLTIDELKKGSTSSATSSSSSSRDRESSKGSRRDPRKDSRNDSKPPSADQDQN